MANFRFEAADAQGAIQRGTLVADSARSARAQLRAQGLTALELREAAARRGQIELFGPRLSDSDLAWATRQLASLLAAGLPLEAALTATVEQAEKSTSPIPSRPCAPMYAAASAFPIRCPRARATFRPSIAR